MKRTTAALVFSGVVVLGCRDGVPRGEPAAGPPAPAGTTIVPATPSSVAAGRRVQLQGGTADGIPVHATIGDSRVSARLPAGSEVEVVEEGADGRWLRIRSSDGTGGWITRRYIVGGVGDAGAGAPHEDELLPAGSVWRSLADCETALREKRKLERPSGVARIGTWNVRWFPDGKPGHGSDEGGTDIAWLACAITWLDVDAMAIQEAKNNDHAREKAAELLRLLDRSSGGSWAIELDDCPNLESQHVGVLYDKKRVTASNRVTLASLNPRGEKCKDNLRPGFGTYLKFAGGLDLFLVSVHAKSGSERRALDLREVSLKGFDRAVGDLSKSRADPDILFAGDFNTMGCKDCSPPVAPGEEVSRIDELLGNLKTPFRRISPSAGCSEYHDREGTLLDHFIAAKSFVEVASDAHALVSGICGESACRTGPRGRPPAAQEHLSDHCPVVLDIPDRDQD